MLPEDKYFQTLTEEQLWQRYCGFLGLTIEEFMTIQEQLLLEQIEAVAGSPLGKRIMNNQKPKTVAEFRQLVPLTTYDAYAPYMGERQEDALAEEPYFWSHTAGRMGNFKWIPYTRYGFERISKYAISAGILASTDTEGRVNLAPGDRLLLNIASRPYMTGSLFHHFGQRLSFRSIPPMEQAEEMEFGERVREGFKMALRTGVDYIFSISSVLVKLGSGFAEQSQEKTRLSLSMLHPAILLRLSRAWLRSKMGRRGILPKDLWAAKGILTAGTDTAIYKDDIVYYWGRTPYESYGSTEMVLSAIQSWDKEKGMYFLPDVAFWEFIPEEERLKGEEDSSYQPSTVLLSETEAGKLYEVVLTHFHGMPLLRYRIGDLIEIIVSEDEETGIKLPQMVFQTRVDGIIHLAGLTSLDEKTIWRAIANTGLKYEDWSACKEYDQNQAFLRLYLELKEDREAEEVERLIDEQLKVVDADYGDLGSWLGLQPVRVTLLSRGTFQRYYEEMREQGADLSHLKPPHMNPSDFVVQRLLQLSKKG